MSRTFHTNRNTILFYGLLSVVVVPFGVINLYRALTQTGTYSIGLRSVLALLLPALTLLSWRNGRLVVEPDGVRIGRTPYASRDHRFTVRTERRALKDRPLTSLWRRDYDVLSIARNGGGEVHSVPLEMSRDGIERLRQAIGI